MRTWLLRGGVALARLTILGTTLAVIALLVGFARTSGY